MNSIKKTRFLRHKIKFWSGMQSEPFFFFLRKTIFNCGGFPSKYALLEKTQIASESWERKRTVEARRS